MISFVQGMNYHPYGRWDHPYRTSSVQGTDERPYRSLSNTRTGYRYRPYRSPKNVRTGHRPYRELNNTRTEIIRTGEMIIIHTGHPCKEWNISRTGHRRTSVPCIVRTGRSITPVKGSSVQVTQAITLVQGSFV